jgi:hypothetical protein
MFSIEFIEKATKIIVAVATSVIISSIEKYIHETDEFEVT